MKTKILFLLAFSVLLISGCGQLERDNPYDPLKTIAPEKPTGLTITTTVNYYTDDVVLRWNANTDYVDGYKIYNAIAQVRDPQNKISYDLIATVPPTTSYVVNYLKWGYYFVITAYSSKGGESGLSTYVIRPHAN